MEVILTLIKSSVKPSLTQGEKTKVTYRLMCPYLVNVGLLIVRYKYVYSFPVNYYSNTLYCAQYYFFVQNMFFSLNCTNINGPFVLKVGI